MAPLAALGSASKTQDMAVTTLLHTIHISQIRKVRPRNGKGLAQSHMIRTKQLGQAQAPGLARNQHANSQAGTEELLGLASPRDTKACSEPTALTDVERPGPSSGQSGGCNVELESGSPDLVARNYPGVPVTLGRPVISGSSTFPPVPWGQNHTCPTCPWVASRLKQWEDTLETIKCWTSLSCRPCPVPFCAYTLHAV